MARMGRGQRIPPRLITPHRKRGFWYRETFEGGVSESDLHGKLDDVVIWGGTAGHPYTTTSTGTGATFDLNHTADRPPALPMADRSIKITTGGTQQNDFVRVLNGPTMDFTGRIPAIWWKIDNNSRFLDGTLWIGSGGGLGSAYQFNLEDLDGTNPLYMNNEWQLRTLPWSTASVTGTPNRAALTDINFQIFDNNTGALNIWWGGLFAVPDTTNPYPSGVVSFSFDDGFASHNTEAASYMAGVGGGLKGTAYIISDVIDTGVYCTSSQLQALQNTYGWEIGLHSDTASAHNAGGGFTALTAGQIASNLAANRSFLEGKGISNIRTFAYPQGRHNSTTQQALQDLVAPLYAARTTNGWSTESVRPGNPYRLRTRAIDASTNPSTITGLIDTAIANKEWLILLFHDIKASGATGNEYNRADFRTIVDYAVSSGIAVRPVGDVVSGNTSQWTKTVNSDPEHGSIKYSLGQRAHGSYGINIKTDATGSQITNESPSWPAGSAYSRFYLRINQATTTAVLCRARVSSGGTQVAGLRRTASGEIELRNGTTNTGTKTTSLTDKMVRVEWFLDASANTQTLRVYYDSDLEGTTATEEITDSINSADPTMIQWGLPNDFETNADELWDDFAIDTAGWIGPLPPQVAPQQDGVATLPATSNLVIGASVTEVAAATLAATSNLVTVGTVTSPYPAVLGATGTFDEAETQCFMGVLQDSNGNLYRIIESDLANNNQPRAMKSTDQGKTWSEQDAANRPGTSASVICDLESGHQTYDSVRKAITFTWERSSNTAYSQFRTSDHATNPDTWTSNVRELHTSSITAQTPQYTSHTSPTNQSYEWLFWGTSTKPQFRSRTNSSTLGSITDVDSTGSSPSAVLAPNTTDTYIVYEKSNQLHFKKLTATGTLDSSSTRLDSTGLETGASGAVVAQACPVTYLAPNNDVVMSTIFIDVNGDLRSVDMIAGSVQSEQTITTSNPAKDVGDTTSLQGVIALTVNGSTLYAVWADGSTFDVKYSSRTYGGAWSAATTLYDTAGGEDIDWVSASIVDHSGTKYLAYTYYVGPFVEDVGNTYYNRLALITQHDASATLAATSNLVTTAVLDVKAAATLAATSNLVTTAVLTVPATASLPATSDLTTLAANQVNASATLASTSNLTVSDLVTAVATATLSATSNLVTEGTVTPVAGSDATLAATSNLVTTAVLTIPAAATLASTSNLTVSDLVTVIAAASLPATSNLVTAGQVTNVAVSTIAASSDLIVSGAVTAVATALLDQESDLAGGTPEVTVFASATLAAASELAVSASVTAVAVAPLPATSNLSITPAVEVLAAATLAATSNLVAEAGGALAGEATLDQPSNLTVSATLERFGVATLAATSNLTTTADVPQVGVPEELASFSDLFVTGTRGVVAAWSRTVVSNLVTFAVVPQAGQATIAATSNLVIGGSVTKQAAVFIQGQPHLSAVPSIIETQASATLTQVSNLVTGATTATAGGITIIQVSDLILSFFVRAQMDLKARSWLRAEAGDPRNTTNVAGLGDRRWKAALNVSRSRYSATLD